VYGATAPPTAGSGFLRMGGKRWTDIGKRYTRTRLGRLEPFLFPGNLCRVRGLQLRIKAVLYSTKSISNDVVKPGPCPSRAHKSSATRAGPHR